jgi:hypothetical protein
MDAAMKFFIDFNEAWLWRRQTEVVGQERTGKFTDAANVLLLRSKTPFDDDLVSLAFGIRRQDYARTGSSVSQHAHDCVCFEARNHVAFLQHLRRVSTPKKPPGLRRAALNQTASFARWLTFSSPAWRRPFCPQSRPGRRRGGRRARDRASNSHSSSQSCGRISRSRGRRRARRRCRA